MRLQIIHRTQFTYASPVRGSFNEVRLKPVSNEHQTCEAFILKVQPATRLAHYQDFYRNWVHHFEIAEPHTSLLIESNTTVTTNSVNWLEPAAMPAALTRLPECEPLDRCFDYLQASSYIELSPEVWRLGLDAIAGQSDIWQAAQAIMRWVHGAMTYAPQSTTVRTHMKDALAGRMGVCQDFAHVMIGLCRSVRIPALYVSGYLHVPGAQDSHAWVEVFLPGLGWRGLDPTHARPVDERYVKLAVGRDYRDARPVRGDFKGSRESKMSVEVTITDLNSSL